MIEVPIASGSLLENRPISELPPMKQTVIERSNAPGKASSPTPLPDFAPATSSTSSLRAEMQKR